MLLQVWIQHKFPRRVFVHIVVIFHELLMRILFLWVNFLRFSEKLIVTPDSLLHLSVPNGFALAVHHSIFEFTLLIVSIGPDLSSVSMLFVIFELTFEHATIIPVSANAMHLTWLITHSERIRVSPSFIDLTGIVPLSPQNHVDFNSKILIKFQIAALYQITYFKRSVRFPLLQ